MDFSSYTYFIPSNICEKKGVPVPICWRNYSHPLQKWTLDFVYNQDLSNKFETRAQRCYVRNEDRPFLKICPHIFKITKKVPFILRFWPNSINKSCRAYPCWLIYFSCFKFEPLIFLLKTLENGLYEHRLFLTIGIDYSTKLDAVLVWARGVVNESVVEGQGLHRASQGKMEHQLESQFTKLETASRN